MKTDLIEELRWRGLLQDVMPGTEELLEKETVSGYIGFDPTADSLHIGSLTQIFTLMRLQKAGHKPIALLGGATGMVGDPSGKSAERNLIDDQALERNVNGIKQQLERFLDFSHPETGAELVNNYDWMKDYSFLHFIRDVGKHITVNYMMAKDSVKNRINVKRLESNADDAAAEQENEKAGMSFTEFTYQLLQAYDFYYLWKHKNVKLQMGGSDQFGNITTGTELIRRKDGGKAWGLTTQLVKKADGTKFGKTESGNIWLDKEKTTPYKFYQFWINATDADAKSWIKIFTFFSKEETEALIAEHEQDEGKKVLQKTLAKELTKLVHGEAELDAAMNSSTVLFNGTLNDLVNLQDKLFLDIFEGVPQFSLDKSELSSGIGVVDLFSTKTTIFKSKGDARKMIQGGGISINKEKITDHELVINTDNLIKDRYILLQKGKKEYFLCNVN